ncbi:hypothetical protein LY90DRAFT_661817 [Neocallimastix californiae]|uniref:DNA polymerase n=1 Tax=Neocallimastix californiae TaxID=1754190 RepID=A0A1Y2C292_9FUNG|nr:hypothetical protein LY90DRAFT_661817 [Neocallimastix californiae]|eukprot:ORY41158.1 hypothetical protein LY90DRAFT_661817 [Neocallimastix californiae]
MVPTKRKIENDNKGHVEQLNYHQDLKKFKNEGPSSFELQLQKMEAESEKTVDPVSFWNRPPLPDINPDEDPIIFQQIEIDDTVEIEKDDLNTHEYGSNRKFAPVIRFYGCTEKGNSVVCNVHGFHHYLYVPAPANFTEANLPDFKEALNNETINDVKKVEIVLRESIYHYHGNQKSPFIKITTSLPKQLSGIKRRLEQGINIKGFGERAFNTFDSTLNYDLRFMIDRGITGVNWLECPPKKYTIKPKEKCVSNCQLEIDIDYKDLISHEPENEWSHIAPLRILSFDIECSGRPGVFPEPKHDSVIQIANVVTIQGESKPFIKNIFTLNTCSPIIGSHVIPNKTEEELLQRWSEFFVRVDPDVITGYNILNFDFPYLLERAATLKVNKFPFLGRIKSSKTEAKDSRFSSRAYGTRESKSINLDGRIDFDVLPMMQRDHKLRSYTLNSVCNHFLGEQKEDVHHSIITDLQKDAWLPQRLLDKLMCLINYIEMARVTGVPFNLLLQRGQQIKVISQLYRKAIEEDLIIPFMPQEAAEEQYTGATVIEPKKGFYDCPISTLDFNSLYPSIMMAHNLCYTTLLNKQTIERLGLKKDIDYIVTPSNDMFVKEKHRKGLLPSILKHLIDARKKAKADLKKETDPFKKSVLNGRQLALKISANSVYGFTGATIGRLPCIPISQSTTAYGREMIEKTKYLVESHYSIANGFPHDATVIYGDTDSVMVRFGVETLEEAMKLGKEAAQFVTQHFIKPINLEFEKVYFPYLLISKKRYAGLFWTRTEKYDKLDAKGIETVRRDNCRLVQNVIDTCLRKMLIDHNVEAAIDYAKQVISDLLQNKIDLSQLVITKALSKTEYDGKQAHKELADRMRKRDPGSAPNLGDRVAYVIIKAAKDAAAYEKSEDPLYVLEHNIPIDTKYYLDNQLSKPLMRIFEPILGDKAQSLLSGNHTRVISVAAPTIGGLMKFAVKQETCMGCKAILRKDEKAVCFHCRPKLGELYQRQIMQFNLSEKKYSRLWTQCQRCQGSLHQDIICTSKDCPIFYMRKKIQKDMKDNIKQIERFQFE